MPCYRNFDREPARAFASLEGNPGPWVYFAMCGTWTNAVADDLDDVDCPNCIRAEKRARARRRRRSRAR